MRNILKSAMCMTMIFQASCPLTADAAVNIGHPEKTAVLAVISDFFRAMESKDSARIRQIMLPESQTLRIEDGTNNPYRISGLDQYVNGLENANAKLQERIINPDVKINGRLGYVWAFFQIYADGTMFGCGVNLFNMVKTTDGWRMASGTYSVIEKEKCAKYYGPTEWLDGQYIIQE